MGILKNLNVVNLYRVMSMLKPKINVNLSQLLCIVVSSAQLTNLSDLVGFNCTLECLKTLFITATLGKEELVANVERWLLWVSFDSGNFLFPSNEF